MFITKQFWLKRKTRLIQVRRVLDHRIAWGITRREIHQQSHGTEDSKGTPHWLNLLQFCASEIVKGIETDFFAQMSFRTPWSCFQPERTRLAVTSILKNCSRTQDRKLKMSYNP